MLENESLQRFKSCSVVILYFPGTLGTSLGVSNLVKLPKSIQVSTLEVATLFLKHYWEGQGDLVSRLITSIARIITLGILSPPETLQVGSSLNLTDFEELGGPDGEDRFAFVLSPRIPENSRLNLDMKPKSVFLSLPVVRFLISAAGRLFLVSLGPDMYYHSC